jgi:hypothetical protein
MKKNLLILIVMLSWTCASLAQADTRNAAVSAIRQLTQHYRKIPLLGFDVEYRYAAEAKPAVYLDSMKGSVKLSGNRYWYQLDSTEVLYGDKYVVAIYPEDKIMYLSKPSSQAAAMNPMALLDSLLFKAPGLQYSLTSSPNQQIVTVRFEKSSSYKKIDYYINTRTGFLSKMVSTVNAEQLYTPEAQSKLSGEKTFAIVETCFTNYREQALDETVFDTGRYFKKEGQEYITVAPYNIYKIFLGNPGL